MVKWMGIEMAKAIPFRDKKSRKKCFLSSVAYDTVIHHPKNDIGINKNWKNFIDASFPNWKA